MDEDIAKGYKRFKKIVTNDYHGNRMEVSLSHAEFDLSPFGYDVVTERESWPLEKSDLEWLLRAIEDGVLTKGDVDVTIYNKRKEIGRFIFSLERGLINFNKPIKCFTPLPEREDDDEPICSDNSGAPIQLSGWPGGLNAKKMR